MKTLNILYCWQLAQLFRAWCKCRICDMSRYDIKYDFSYLNFIWIRSRILNIKQLGNILKIQLVLIVAEEMAGS